MLDRTIEVITETATVALFDTEGLAAHKGDRDDWFAIERIQLDEMRRGRLAVVPMPSDGRFLVRVTNGDATPSEQRFMVGEDAEQWLDVTSGRVHCTTLESAPAGGRDARSSRDQILEIEPGRYRVHCTALDLERDEADLPDVVIRLVAMKERARPPRPAAPPELWPGPPSVAGVVPEAPAGVHRLPEDGDASLRVDMVTGMVVLFDPEALEHRSAGSAAWIDDDAQLLEEARAGHLAFVYTIESDLPARVSIVMRKLHDLESAQVVATDEDAWLEVPSGRLLCGRAADLPRRDFDPGSEIAGRLEVAAGRYRVLTHALRLDETHREPRFVMQLTPLGEAESPPDGPDAVRDLYEGQG